VTLLAERILIAETMLEERLRNLLDRKMLANRSLEPVPASIK
jgi:hypothetical protein